MAPTVVIVILVAGFAYFYLTSTETIGSMDSSIASQQRVINSQQGVISGQSSTIQSQSSSINELQGTVTAQAKSISTLQANVTAYRQLVTSLNDVIASDKTQLQLLQVKASQDDFTITALNNQIATAQALIANLTSTLNLEVSEILVNGQSVTIFGAASNPRPFLTFDPAHAGFVLIAFSSPSESFFANTNYQPSVSNPSGATFESAFDLMPGSPSVGYIIIPVVPGTANEFSFVTNAATDGSALVTVTYFY